MNFLTEKTSAKENHSDIGTSFEHFIIQEVRAYLSYAQNIENLTYWRSKDYEVDLLVGAQTSY